MGGSDKWLLVKNMGGARPRGGLREIQVRKPGCIQLSFCAFLSPDKQSLRSEPSVVIVSCKDGRQLLSIPQAGKRHAGLYECSATNALGSITSSCTVAVARELGGQGQCYRYKEVG